jgi:hypothetical protein
MEPRWSELESRSFLVVRSFLSRDELELARRDFQAQAVDEANANEKLKFAAPDVLGALSHKVLDIAARVRAVSTIDTDTVQEGAYFSTGLGIDQGWHQDHESFYVFQNHHDYLNFYIPILKPRADKTNLSVVPREVLRARFPRVFRKVFRDGGATVIFRKNGTTVVRNGNDDRRYFLNADLDELAETPELAEGDLLLIRGDAVHRTQDTETDRTSLSIRVVSSKTIVRRERLASGGMVKAGVMRRHRQFYSKAFRIFRRLGTEELPLLTWTKLLTDPKLEAPRPVSNLEFLVELAWEKLRSRPPGKTSGKNAQHGRSQRAPSPST